MLPWGVAPVRDALFISFLEFRAWKPMGRELVEPAVVLKAAKMTKEAQPSRSYLCRGSSCLVSASSGTC